MSETPLVSIIILNFNGKDFIGECLDSVLKANYPRFEVVVVDNNSTDGSRQYLRNYQLSITNFQKKENSGNYQLPMTNYQKTGDNRNFQLSIINSQKTANNFQTKQPNLKVVFSDRNLYFTGGNNLGAKIAKGEKLIFLNSDTVVDPNFIKELVSFAGKRKKYLVQPKILSYYQKNVIDNTGGHYTFFGFGYGVGRGEIDHGQYNKNQLIDYINGTCFMIDRDFFWQLGGFDERLRYFYEDVDLSLRGRRKGGECWYCYKSIIYHKGGLSFKNNISKLKVLYYSLRNRLLVLTKHFFNSRFK